MLREIETPGSAAVSLEAFAAHLRLPEGFGGEAPGALETYARAATAAVEAMTGLALISRRVLWTVTRWGNGRCERVPVAPVERVNAVTRVLADGSWEAVDLSAVWLRPDDLRPMLSGARGGSLPAVPRDGRVEVELLAGFGATPDAVPAELRQAVMLLGAHYHEQRHVTADPERAAPYGVAALVARWREVRL